MRSLDARLEKLECAQVKVRLRVFSDIELAVRLNNMLEAKAPGWERVAKLVATVELEQQNAKS